jgi:replicative DNA helicase Mcm
MEHGLLERLVEFYTTHGYKEAIAEAVEKPNDKESLWIDWKDLYRFDPDVADDALAKPDTIQEHLQEAADMVDMPIPQDISDINIRIYNLPETETYQPSQIRSDQGNRYIAIESSLERITTPDDLPEVVCFVCQRCGTATRIPQDVSDGELQEPHECAGCERQGPFRVNDDESEWADYSKLRLEARPGKQTDSDAKITGYLLDDLIDYGGDAGLMGRVGEPITAYGVLRRTQKTGRGENSLLFDHVLEVQAIEFERDQDVIDIEAHRDEFERLAERDDAVDIFAESIAPNLHTTDAWDAAFEFAVAYLFGAPRIDLENGPTYRGDLHFMIISDFGMGKSDFAGDIEAYSPKCISKSTTALGSGVGLTAAAVKDDFGEGQWTIKPGLLVKANGGHLILDEIDKGPDELTDMNDAIEGKQQVDVEKAGKSVTYNSKTAIMALGNPVEGRFDPNQPISTQLGIDQSLTSRFDGIVTMEDSPDEEQDRKVAGTFGKAYTEAQQAQYSESESFDVLDRTVTIDVGRAWIKYARENVHPTLTYEQFKELEDWYAQEVRTLNKSVEDREDMPVPATVRVLGATVKMSIAFARAKLQDAVQPQQVERAKKLGHRLVKQNWNGDSFDAAKEHQSQPQTQQERIKAIEDEIRSKAMTVEELSEATGIEERKVEDYCAKLAAQGEAYEPSNGEYKHT